MFLDKYIKHRSENPLPEMSKHREHEEKEENIEIIMRKGKSDEDEIIRYHALELAIRARDGQHSVYGGGPTLLQQAVIFEKFLRGE